MVKIKKLEKIKKGSSNENKKLIFDTSKVKCFYDDNYIHKYFKKNVVYIAVICKIGKYYLCKFGKSSRILKRDLTEHKKTFGDQIKIIYVIETDNNSVVEDAFKESIKAKGLYKKMVFNGLNRDELFVTSNIFTIENAKELMDEIVKDYPLESLKKKDEEILKIKLEHEQFMKKEETKQKELDNKNLELKNKNLELNIKFIELQKTQSIEQREEIKKDIKEEIKNEIKNEDKNYEDFLNECTEECIRGHIHCNTLYDSFKIWHSKNYPYEKVPNRNDFINGIRKYKDVTNVRVDKKVQLGIKKLKFKKEL